MRRQYKKLSALSNGLSLLLKTRSFSFLWLLARDFRITGAGFAPGVYTHQPPAQRRGRGTNGAASATKAVMMTTSGTNDAPNAHRNAER
jgi:hypothetical protein